MLLSGALHASCTACVVRNTVCTACRLPSRLPLRLPSRLPSRLPWRCSQSAGGAAAAGLAVHRVAGLPHAFGTQLASRTAVVTWLTTTVHKMRGGGGRGGGGGGGGGGRSGGGAAPGARIAASRRVSRSPART